MNSSSWPVLVTIHNVIRVPKEVASLKTPGLKFRVTLNVVGSDPSSTAQLATLCPEVTATFEPRDVQMVQQDHFEVKLDGTSGSGRGSLEWHAPTSTVYVLVSIKEESGGDSKTVAAGTSYALDLNEVIEKRKLRTLIFGTTMGHVGVSFAVAPSDTAGYRRRLEAFLSSYNAAGLKLVGNVVASVGELDTFTKVNKKYKLVDYHKRVMKFFSTYGPDHMDQCDVILKQWENREEELMRNLVLDNGPELCDVDLKQRLVAFGRKYKLQPPEFDVAQLLQLHGKDPEALFEELTAKHGAEPDPRLYLFPVTYYGEKPESPRRGLDRKESTAAPLQSEKSSAKLQNSAPPASTPTPPLQQQQQQQATAAPLPLQAQSSQSFGPTFASSVYEPPASSQPTAATRQSPVPPSSSSMYETRPPPMTTSSTPAYVSSADMRGYTSSYNGMETARTGSQASTRSAGAPVAVAVSGPTPQQVQAQPYQSLNAVEQWSALVEDLRKASIPAAELHYLSEASFLSLLTELGYSATAKQLLLAEWNRRTAASLRMEQLSTGDSLFEAAKRDVITVSGLHPLNINVVGVTALRNAEHETSFSLRLGEAKMRTTERLLLVGDHQKLVGYAISGVSQQPHLDTSRPAAIFNRKPFYSFQRPTSVAVLVCDVVIGKPFIGATTAGAADPTSQLSTAKEGTATFLAEYDSCVFLDPVGGQSVAVYQPQQVLPKYLVQCNVDTSLCPCPAHPSKPVEYFVVDSNVFACSQCVVMGQHRGKEVITVEDATLQARAQLQDVQRDVLHIVSEMAAAEADCDRQLQTLAQSEMRMNVSRQIEAIRREAEQRIAALQVELENFERQRKDVITDARSQARIVMTDAQNVATQLDDGLRQKGPNDVINLLINTRRSGILDVIRDRANSVRAAGPGIGALPVPASLANAANVSTAGGNDAAPTQRILGGVQQRNSNAFTPSAVVTSSRPDTQYRNPSSNDDALFGGNSGLNKTPRAGVPNTPSVSFAQAPAGGEQPLQQQQHPSSSLSNNNDATALYSKFLNLKQQSAAFNTTSNPTQTSAMLLNQDEARQPSAMRLAVKTTADLEAKRMKDLVTTGWAEFRKGDKAAAHRIWLDVYERNVNNAVGARSKAYIAEAIEKNYASAAQWYEKALSYDPQDCLTLYNYGVLLESVLDRKRDALQLFETAFRLGDQTAGKRAAQLRQTL